MTIENHPELVARLATSNISTEDFSYLTTELMEPRTCDNCKYSDGFNLDDKSNEMECEMLYAEAIRMLDFQDFGCNKHKRKTNE